MALLGAAEENLGNVGLAMNPLSVRLGTELDRKKQTA